MNDIGQQEVILIRPSTAKVHYSGKLFPPYGLLFLAESLMSKGYIPHIVDDVHPDSLESVFSLVNGNTLCFGLSTMSGEQLVNACEIARTLKRKYPRIPCIWGGVHVTCQPEETLRSELVDFIVWGEGEETFELVLRAIKCGDAGSLKDKKGVGYKQNGRFHVGANSGYTSLDRLFLLPYQLLNMERYCRQLASGELREFPTWTSRGCPHRCAFCSNASSTWPNTEVRYHSIEHVVADVKTLVLRYNADMISFQEDNFVTSEKRLHAIFSALRAEGIRVRYKIVGRVDRLVRLSRATWEMLKENNVTRVSTGIESGSQRILDYMKKNIRVSQVYELDELLNQFEFSKGYNFLICTPAETREDLKATLRVIADIAEKTKDFVVYPFGTLHKYIPLPGTEMYQDAIRKGFVPPSNLQEGGSLEFDNFDSNMKQIRPWIQDSDVTFIKRSVMLVELLNSLFCGQARINRIRIEETIAGIRKHIAGTAVASSRERTRTGT